jgi:hypothetical protein
MPPKVIRVIQQGNSVCRAVPASEFADRAVADEIRWKNLTNGSITLFLPAGVFSAQATSEDIAPGGQSAAKPVLASAAPGHHPYTIFCTATNGFAIGNSEPEIIVE